MVALYERGSTLARVSRVALCCKCGYVRKSGMLIQGATQCPKCNAREWKGEER